MIVFLTSNKITKFKLQYISVLTMPIILTILSNCNIAIPLIFILQFVISICYNFANVKKWNIKNTFKIYLVMFVFQFITIVVKGLDFNNFYSPSISIIYALDYNIMLILYYLHSIKKGGE